MKIFYVTFNDGELASSRGIFESQVVAIVSTISKYNDVELICFSRKAKKDYISELAFKYKIKHRTIKYKNILSIYLSKKTLLSQLNLGVSDIFYARETMASLLLYTLGINKNAIICDKRGIPPLESFYNANRNILSKYARYIYYQFFEHTSFIIFKNFKFISTNMYKYYYNKYDLRLIKYFITPTSVKINVSEAQLSIISSKWESPTELIFVYSGGSDTYHNFDEVLILMDAIFKKFNSKYSIKSIVYSDISPDKISEYNISFPNIEFKSFVSNMELREVLKTTHFGICLRDNSIVNQISSPTKISEYLLYNNKIIYSGIIGSVEDVIKLTSNTIFLDEEILNNSNLPLINNKDSYNSIKDYFNVESHSMKYIQFAKEISMNL